MKQNATAPENSDAAVTGADFCSTFTVILGAAKAGIAQHWVRIHGGSDKRFTLEYSTKQPDEHGETEWVPLEKNLRFDSHTCTLQSTGCEVPRCISLWHSPDFGCHIFAMRRTIRLEESYSQFLGPWEREDDDGTWGAEQIPPNEGS